MLQLRRIQVLRDLGFTLEETRRLIHGATPPQALAALLRAKREELHHSIQEASARLDRLDARLLILEQEPDMPTFQIALKSIPEVLVLSVRDPALQVIDESGELDISALYDRLYRAVPHEDRSLPQINLWTDSADGPPTAEVAHVLSTWTEAPEGTRVYLLPELPTAAVLTYRGHYAGQEMVNALAALHGWVESSGHQELGPTRQVFLRPTTPGNTDNFEIELQIPVG